MRETQERVLEPVELMKLKADNIAEQVAIMGYLTVNLAQPAMQAQFLTIMDRLPAGLGATIYTDKSHVPPVMRARIARRDSLEEAKLG